MIRYFGIEERSLLEQPKMEESFWTHVTDPTNHEIMFLEKELEVPLDFLTDPLDADENSRVEYEDGHLLIILRVPMRVEEDVPPFITIPMGIIVTENRIITICRNDTEILKRFINGTHRPFDITQQRFVLQIMQKNAVQYLNYLKDINRNMNDLEKNLHQTMRNQELTKLMSVEKCLVYFNTSLTSNEIMLEKFSRSRWLREDSEADDLLDDVIVENKQAIAMASIYAKIVSNMMGAFSSMISNNLNVVMKFLTSITIILMLPTLIASFYGMNLKLPLANSPHAFLLVTLISTIFSAVVVLIFIKRKLF
ncbi:MAG: magnesium transporter CorA family protein [Candidatus Cloacimonetes bacterium]|nr:magnesium transporter CorA family protein [Candidatus Cloacimonadota bacterium]